MPRKKSHIFRMWFYFRNAWTTYIAFVIGATNAAITTYYLAINNSSVLKDIFPSFTHYVLILSVILIPTIFVVGYVHLKKSPAYKNEVDIIMESNKHILRQIQITETMLFSFIYQNDLISKLINNDKLSDAEVVKFKEIQENLQKFKTKRVVNWDEISSLIDTIHKHDKILEPKK